MQSPVKTVSNWANTNLMAQRRELRALVDRHEQRVEFAVVEGGERGKRRDQDLSSSEHCPLPRIAREDAPTKCRPTLHAAARKISKLAQAVVGKRH